MDQLQKIIETAFERRAEITPRNADAQLKEAVDAVITRLDNGTLRVAEKIDGEWFTHQWLKKAVLLSFRLEDNAFIKGGFTNYYDKVPSKFADYNSRDFREGGFRVVPPAAARRGAYIAKNVVLMPSYVNIGAYVDEGTMVDTWATVGSCAQIGKNVHLSGGVGIGGVLEPVQANPTIIGDNCFVGARSEIVEGVILEDNVVISMGVFIEMTTLSSRITRSFRWACSSARAPRFTIARPVPSPMAEYLQDRSWSAAVCLLRMANTICTAR